MYVRRKLGVNVNGLLGESDFNVFYVFFFSEIVNVDKVNLLALRLGY